MNYQSIRPQIKSGDQIAFTHTRWSSLYDIQVQLIRVMTQSEYCHIGTAWVSGGRVFVLEAVTPLIRIYPLSRLGSFYWIPTEDYWDDQVEEFALSKVGQPYSKKQAVMAFLNKIKNGTDTSWECAEYSVSILSQKDILPLDTQATPAVVVRKLQEKGCDLHWVINE